MIVSGIALYFYTKAILTEEIEEELFSNKNRVEQLLIGDSDIKGVPPIITVEKVNHAEAETLTDTLLFDPFQNEVEIFRQLSGTKNVNGQDYRITVRAMVIESEDILEVIIITFSIVILIAFIILYFLNKVRNKKLWQPFFTNLDRLKKFSIKSDESLVLIESDIKEFDDLNKEMIILSSKIQGDYKNLKQFTEDVSHEMQTPLAIMQAKIETVIDDQHINEHLFNQLSSLQNDIQRLKQLNKRLIILAKIDNNQFTSEEEVSINDILDSIISNFSEITTIPITYTQNATINILMDKSLTFVLCNNLLSNAIKHNIQDKEIQVRVVNNTIQFCNAGNVALSQPELIFERFYKESKKPDSTGLGLSIVKKICDYHGFVPSYEFKNDTHVFQIEFVK